MAADDIRKFLAAIDDELAGHAGDGETVDLYLLGRSALILGYGLGLSTKDVDVVDVDGSRLLGLAVDLFGKNGPRRALHGFYLETVSSGLPPLPIGYQKRCVAVPGPWKVIRPMRPEPHDLIVTKLRRFHPRDREDVQFLCDTGKIEADTLRERFNLAHAFSDRDDPHVVAAGANLDTVVSYLNGERRAV